MRGLPFYCVRRPADPRRRHTGATWTEPERCSRRWLRSASWRVRAWKRNRSPVPSTICTDPARGLRPRRQSRRPHRQWPERARPRASGDSGPAPRGAAGPHDHDRQQRLHAGARNRRRNRPHLEPSGAAGLAAARVHTDDDARRSATRYQPRRDRRLRCQLGSRLGAVRRTRIRQRPPRFIGVPRQRHSLVRRQGAGRRLAGLGDDGHRQRFTDGAGDRGDGT
jgi:hypothetical protein